MEETASAGGLALRGGQIGDIKSDQFRRWRQRLRAAHPAPAGEVRPVFGIGSEGVFRGGLTGIVARGLDQTVKRPRACEMRGQGEGLCGALVAFSGNRKALAALRAMSYLPRFLRLGCHLFSIGCRCRISEIEFRVCETVEAIESTIGETIQQPCIEQVMSDNFPADKDWNAAEHRAKVLAATARTADPG